MSQWTHIAGVVRFDTVRFNYGENKPDALSGLPAGSEGSLEARLEENPDLRSLASYTLTIWGDLRDFGKGDVPEITAYLDRVCHGQMVRQGVVLVEVEFGPTLMIVHDHRSEAWKITA